MTQKLLLTMSLLAAFPALGMTTHQTMMLAPSSGARRADASPQQGLDEKLTKLLELIEIYTSLDLHVRDASRFEATENDLFGRIQTSLNELSSSDVRDRKALKGRNSESLSLTEAISAKVNSLRKIEGLQKSVKTTPLPVDSQSPAGKFLTGFDLEFFGDPQPRIARALKVEQLVNDYVAQKGQGEAAARGIATPDASIPLPAGVTAGSSKRISLASLKSHRKKLFAIVGIAAIIAVLLHQNSKKKSTKPAPKASK